MVDFEILTPELNQKFHKDGYLVIPGFLREDEITALLTRSKELLDEFSLDGHPLTCFTTDESGDKKHIRFFLEDEAFGEDGKLNRPKELAVNKMGHALHELDPIFRSVTLENPRLQQLVLELGFHRSPLVLQSMVIFKQPSIGGQVPEHNDSTFLYTDPPSALGFWFALEECTPQNGALSFLPGSHLRNPITKRFVRLPEGGTGFESLSAPDPLATSSPSDYKQEPCEAGTLVLIHGSVLHKSEKNTSPHTRYAYTFHMIESGATYDAKNWLQPTPEMPFSPLFSLPPLVARRGGPSD
ncbi:hypothetical protein BS47DRAFT_1340514 [Hydnum rufescens UP504]|uniref:Phytanoyl-CoA dioxygenase n=1 Tax=Hydnum rufescens UP504 TaxID=1448309 RepID=A0A9P6B2Q7_9AGAM|nr:hypothetical protein BS47DRAFT_1340514 [Hydnum rufescens UP504]